MNPSSDRQPEGRSALDATLPETLPELVAELTDTQRQINRLHAR